MILIIECFEHLSFKYRFVNDIESMSTMNMLITINVIIKIMNGFLGCKRSWMVKWFYAEGLVPIRGILNILNGSIFSFQLQRGRVAQGWVEARNLLHRRKRTHPKVYSTLRVQFILVGTSHWFEEDNNTGDLFLYHSFWSCISFHLFIYSFLHLFLLA